MNIGTVLFIITMVPELCFAGYCLRSKNIPVRFKGVIKGIAPAVFLAGLLLSVIEWSFRWYLFGIFLVIQIINGSLLYFKNTSVKPFSSGHIIRNTVFLFLLCVVCLCPAWIFPQYQQLAVTGKYKVATEPFTYTGNQTNRKLNVQFWYPENSEMHGETFPLVIFSHGAMGIKSSNVSLYQELASNGYVVCSIDHRDQCLYTRDEDGTVTFLDMDFMKELMEEDARENIQESYELYQKWMKLITGDINFVLDTILEHAADGNAREAVYKLVDRSRISVMGHSLGGSAALGIGRSRTDVKAVIALESPYMCDIQGVEENKFIWDDRTYPVPVLNLYTDSSWSFLNEWPQYAQNARFRSDSGESIYNVYLQGANHFTLTDLSLSSPLLSYLLSGKKQTIDTEYCLKTTNEICLKFLNQYLKDGVAFSVHEIYP